MYISGDKVLTSLFSCLVLGSVSLWVCLLVGGGVGFEDELKLITDLSPCLSSKND